MKVLLVTQYFFPENFKSNDIAFELAKKGFEVDVLVGIPNYPEGKYFKGYSLFHKRTEKINGVRIYRVFQTPRGRKCTGFRLSLNYLSYMLCASFWAIYLAIFKNYDCVIVHQPSPITQAIPAIILKKIQKIPLYTWVLDIWPDSIISGSGIKNTILLSAIDKIVIFVYNQSDKILISSRQFENLIIAKGNYSGKLIYFPNWSEDMLQMPMKNIPQLPVGFIIMIAGTLGTAQNLDAVMNAALAMKDENEVKWVLAGEGSKKVWVDDYIKEHNLFDTVFTLGRLPFSAMPALYRASNAMLLTLKADYPHIKAVVPARLQSYLAASRPVLAMVEGGSAEIIEEAKCGYAVGAEDYLALVDIIRTKVLPDRENFEAMGLNGRRYYEQNFTKESCMERLISIIESNNITT